MGTSTKHPHIHGCGRMGSPTSSAYKPQHNKAASWDGLLHRHKEMKEAIEGVEHGPHPRTKKVTLPHLKFMDGDEK